MLGCTPTTTLHSLLDTLQSAARRSKQNMNSAAERLALTMASLTARKNADDYSAEFKASALTAKPFEVGTTTSYRQSTT